MFDICLDLTNEGGNDSRGLGGYDLQKAVGRFKRDQFCCRANLLNKIRSGLMTFCRK
jgi:hypothetical protein